MPRRKYFTLEQLERARERLKAARQEAPPAPQRHTTRETIQELRTDIIALQERGYTIEQIAEIASLGLGDELNATSLKQTLKKRSRKRVAPPKTAKQTSDKSAQQTHPAMPKKQDAPSQAQGSSAPTPQQLRERS